MAPDSPDLEQPDLDRPHLEPPGTAWPEAATPGLPSIAGGRSPADKPLIERVVTSPGVRSGYVSLVAHVLACILLAILVLDSRPPRRQRPILVAFDSAADHDPGVDAAEQAGVTALAAAVGGPEDSPAEPPQPADAAATTVDGSTGPPLAEERPDEPGFAMEAGPIRADAAATAEADGHQVLPIAPSDEPGQSGSAAAATAAGQTAGKPRAGNGDRAGAAAAFAARSGRLRGEAAASRGGSAASEAAVERGLAWLAVHQAADGSWRFDLSGCRCDGGCRDPGTIDSTTASTAIALLPFLGAGNTHMAGPYQETVARGIYYLVSRMQSTPRGGDFCEGTLYGHGVTSLVLAEVLGMTRDEFLVPYVHDAVRFIETSQDMHGGGWRYLPGQSGDITVTAWQLAALKSASLAGVGAPSPTIDGVSRFLDRVQTQKGAAYGYRSPAAKPCTSAIGLLCRMYTGWDERQEQLVRGVTNLAKPGPSPTAIYQNFYLSQSLLQLDHPVWPRWNAKNRDQIVQQQARFGHETGSWFFADPDTAPGGRLAHTALAVLTLEVYYRLLPIFRQEAVEGGF